MTIFVDEQLWCLNGSTLRNKANVWKTNDTLNVVDNIEGMTIYVGNVSDNNVLRIKTEDNYKYDVINETVISKTNAKQQLWGKRNPNNISCFIIKNSTTGTVLTATFEGLKVKEEISYGAELFKLVMYGPILVTIGILGMFGNVLSIIVFTRSSMKKSAINAILIGKH